MKIIRLSGNDCGGFRPPKGHLDTQMFPECDGTETDRNIVKKTIERRNKTKKKASIELEAKHYYPIVQDRPHRPKGIWDQWKNGEINDQRFVQIMIDLVHQGLPGVSKDPIVRRGILKALDSFNKTRDFSEAARSIGSFLSMGANVDESHFANSSNWYKRAMEDFPELRGDSDEIRKKWLHPSFRERIIQKFKEEHPNISATLEEIWDWYRKNFTFSLGKPYDWEAHHKRDIERSLGEI